MCEVKGGWREREGEGGEHCPLPPSPTPAPLNPTSKERGACLRGGWVSVCVCPPEVLTLLRGEKSKMERWDFDLSWEVNQRTMQRRVGKGVVGRQLWG